MQRLLLLLSCALVAVMFFANKDMGGDPVTPRGDGVYRPVLARGDGHMLYLMARSTALDLDWDFTNDLHRFGDPWHEPVTATGRKSIVHPIGPALVWTPMIWLGEATAAIANIFGADIPLHGYTLWHQRIVFASSVLFACCAVLLARRHVQQLLGTRWASTYAAVCILLGTSLTYYATNMPSYSHAMDACACTAFLVYWARTLDRRDLRRWCAVGALLGVAALIRTQELGLCVVVAVELARKRDRATLVGAVVAMLVTIVVLVPQMIEWHLVFGSWTGLPQGARFTRPLAPMIGEVLFAPRNGWFSSTPIAYAGVLGLFVTPKRLRFVALAFVLVVAVQVYFSSIVVDWWASASFGQRRLCNVTGPLVFGLACLLHQVGRVIPRRAAHPLFGLVALPVIAWNLDRVTALDHGKAAPAELVPTCCTRVWLPVRPVAQWIYDHLGNPFELPASAWFSLRHRVELSRWDRTVGNYPITPSMADLPDGAYGRLHGTWDLGSRTLDPYLDGWSPPHGGARTIVGSSARVLVPNLVVDAQHATLAVRATRPTLVVASWNDHVVFMSIVEGVADVELEIPAGDLHTNELEIIGHGLAASALTIRVVP